MTGIFWLGVFLLSVGAGLASLAWLVFLMRKKRPTEGAKNLACTFLLLVVIASVGVTAHADGDSRERWEEELLEQAEESELVDLNLLHREFLANELRAEETYQGNRYLVAATISDVAGAEELSPDGELFLTMEVELDGQRLPLTCSFSSEYWEELMTYNVDDVVLFEGTCESAQVWSDCIMMAL